MLFQLDMVRQWSIELAESCPADLAEKRAAPFNNTIRWQFGHILTVAERMLFQHPKQESMLPAAFSEWFEAGTSPDAWNETTPNLAELTTLLKDQHARLLAIRPEQFGERFDRPYYGFRSYGECAGFVVMHESLHLGKVEEMLRVLRGRP